MSRRPQLTLTIDYIIIRNYPINNYGKKENNNGKGCEHKNDDRQRY